MILHARAGAPLWPRPQRQRAEKMMCMTFIFLTLAAWRLGSCENIGTEGKSVSQAALVQLVLLIWGRPYFRKTSN